MPTDRRLVERNVPIRGVSLDTYPLPRVDGPTALPDLRRWLFRCAVPGGLIDQVGRSVGHVREGGFVERALDGAALWWVEPDACDLLAESAPTLPSDFVLDQTAVPTMAGLAVFARDLIGTDVKSSPEQPLEVRVGAMLWGPVAIRPQDIGADEPVEGLGIVMFSHWNIGHAERTIDDKPYRQVHRPDEDVDHVPGDLFAYLGRTDWLDGYPVDRPLPSKAPRTGPSVDESMAEDRRLLAALWSLASTPVTSLTAARFDRAAIRRETRRGLPPPDVRVLTLRAPSATARQAEGATSREWRHQWIVRPHWRWQPYGPGRAQRRLTLIGPYRKGPQDAPLLGGERVWRVAAPPRVE